MPISKYLIKYENEEPSGINTPDKIAAIKRKFFINKYMFKKSLRSVNYISITNFSCFAIIELINEGVLLHTIRSNCLDD